MPKGPNEAQGRGRRFDVSDGVGFWEVKAKNIEVLAARPAHSAMSWLNISC